jgi:hypothetical protein
MNYFVFNNNPDSLRSSIYGSDGTQLRAVAVDSSGEIILSPNTVISVTATDLDIRNLTGATDSVLVYGQNFVEDTVTTTVPSGTTYLMVKDISPYRQNSYFIRNNGSSSVTVTLQIAPVNSDTYYVDNSSAQTVTASSNNITSVTMAMRFARLRVVATTSTSVTVYYNGRA